MLENFFTESSILLVVFSHSVLDFLPHIGRALSFIETFIETQSLIKLIDKFISILGSKDLTNFISRVIDSQSCLYVLDVLRCKLLVC